MFNFRARINQFKQKLHRAKQQHKNEIIRSHIYQEELSWAGNYDCAQRVVGLEPNINHVVELNGYNTLAYKLIQELPYIFHYYYVGWATIESANLNTIQQYMISFLETYIFGCHYDDLQHSESEVLQQIAPLMHFFQLQFKTDWRQLCQPYVSLDVPDNAIIPNRETSEPAPHGEDIWTSLQHSIREVTLYCEIMGWKLIAERLDDCARLGKASVTGEDVYTFRDLAAGRFDLYLDALDAGVPLHDVIGGAKRYY